MPPMRVLDVRDEKEVLKTNLVQFKVTQAEIAQLHKPLLLADRERYYVALKMAERGLVSAPNVAVGEPFNIGLTGLPPAGMPGLDGGAHTAAAQYQVAQHAPAGGGCRSRSSTTSTTPRTPTHKRATAT